MLLQKTIFFLFSINLIKNFIFNVIFPEYFEKIKWKKIAEIGQTKYHLRKYPYKIYYLISLFFGFLYSNLPGFWLGLFVIFLIMFSVGLFALLISLWNNEKDIYNYTEKDLPRFVLEHKMFALFELALLIVWIYSWKDIFI